MDQPAPLTLQLLRQHWGFTELRPLQHEAVAGALQGRDGLVILPTGGGKSLCYQLPALQLKGLTVVVSPLLALIQDQVDGLGAMGIQAAALTSVQDGDERAAIRARVRGGDLDLLYVSPEGLLGAEGEMPAGLRALLADTPLAAFAIDEAHCISQWGHEFRPAYRRLRLLREHFPGVPIRAFTATATEAVRGDIVTSLGLQAPQVLVGDFDRPNLVYRALPRAGKGLEQVREVIAAHPGEAGIVYCNSRKEVEAVAEALQRQGVRALPYHAGFDAGRRQQNQALFTSEQVDVIVATVAFGMGIDRSNVRFVVHTAMPKALEAYQQEAGRAGRDGLPATCVLLHGAADGMQWRKRLAEDLSGPALEAALARLKAMEAYATTVACRHGLLVGYFGQAHAPTSCEACDVCLGEQGQHADAAPIVRALLAGVAATGQRFGVGHVVDVLRGGRTQRVLELRHDALEAHGTLARHAPGDLKVWLGQLVEQGLLERRGEYGVLALTPAGLAALEGEGLDVVRLTAATGAGEGRKARADGAAGRDRAMARGPAAQAVFDALRAWRRDLAADWDVAPYVVLPDTALWALVEARPASLAGLRRVAGVGERRAERFGAVLLEALAAACEAAGLPLADEAASAGAGGRGDDAEVFAHLKAWRLAEARVRGVPPFMVFADAVLKEVARLRPRSEQALGGVKGIGARKLEAFGDGLLAALAEATGVRAEPSPAPVAPSALAREPASPGSPGEASAALSRTVQDTLDLVREGRTPAEIALIRGLKDTTIFTHLRAAIDAGLLGPDDFLPATTRTALVQAAGLLGPETAWGPMRALLPIEVPDGALTCWLAAAGQAGLAPPCPDPALAARCQALLRALEVPQAGLARRLALTLAEPAEPLRALAAHGLGRLGGEQAGEAVQQALEERREASPIVEAALLRAIGELGRWQARDLVQGLVADEAVPAAWRALARGVLRRLEAATAQPEGASAF
ncbi:MAG: RecQ family ATP-dependent DNA helicase [Candidatus Sericytochromatia bacterium]|nr:RecQ family ATP-dependent DNA helicase [Candidatus Sericytochromatia bacterium]